MSKTLRSPRHRQLLALLVQARQGRGLTQAQVAAKLRKPQSFIAKVEGGERRLDVIEFIDLASALRVRPAELIERLQPARGAKRVSLKSQE
jgi:transcriptional regulator with XRE-family HTH domain|nr:Helix-turn-helix domain protein, putative transcriptional regulator [Methylocystis sp. SC2]